MKLKFLAGFYTSYLHKSHMKREVSEVFYHYYSNESPMRPVFGWE